MNKESTEIMTKGVMAKTGTFFLSILGAFSFFGDAERRDTDQSEGKDTGSS